jgi:lipopolysaccharide/colanic/teichoic acid biosynthesis glycosyltransferase
MLVKRTFDLIISFFALLLCLPLVTLVSLAILISSGPPVIFSQKRWGKGKKVFTLYKFRTMEPGAEGKKKKLMPYNEADGPVFKILNDPRYTEFGRALAHTGLDELPQLVNVLKGDMSLVGPRPLPVSEARRVPRRYSARFSVLPGITSSWIVAGSHELSFKQWMRLDLVYVKDWSIKEDVKVLYQTGLLILKWSYRALLRGFGQ